MSKSFTEQLCEAFAVVGQIAPSNHAVNTGDNTIAGIDASNFRRILAILSVGAANANDNTNNAVQLYWRASANSNMAGPTNVASSVPVTIVQQVARSNIALAEVRADQLPANTRYVQPILIVTTGTAFANLIVLGDSASYSPGSQFDVNTAANTITRAVT